MTSASTSDLGLPQGGGDGHAGLWRRVWRNAAMIVSGRAVFGLLNLAAAALGVRAVGIEAFGMVVLLQAYVRLISGLLKFQSWAAVTKFGAEALADGREDDFRRLLGFTLRLDLIGLGASVGLGLAAAPWVGRWLGWPPAAAALAPWFVLTIPFITAATPTGVLRLFDRFGVMVRQHALNAMIRFAGTAVIFFVEPAPESGLGALILVWAAASVFSGLYLMAVAAAEISRRRLVPRLVGSWRSCTAGFPHVWRFVVVLNATSLMDTILEHATVLAVGAMLGPVAAGLFGIVKQMTESLNRLSSLLGPIVFPELAWMEARGHRRAIARLLGRTLVIAGLGMGAFVLVLALEGESFLTLLFGADAAPAAPLLTAAGAAAALMALSFAVEPVMLAIRKEKALLYSAVVSTAVFCAAFYELTLWSGLLGAGLALLLRQALVFGHRLFVLDRALVLNRP